MSRPIERIDQFLDSVDLEHLFTDIWKFDPDEIPSIIVDIDNNLDAIRANWKDLPDLRFSQLLISMGFLLNTPGIWFYKEEYEILIEQGADPAGVNYWGVNFDKDMNRLPETLWKPIKELNTDHLHAIINNGFIHQRHPYMKIMQDELSKRNEKI